MDSEARKEVEEVEAPKAEKASAKKTAPKAPAKPKRVKMVNTRPGNGAIGANASPFEKDVPAWETRGWVRA